MAQHIVPAHKAYARFCLIDGGYFDIPIIAWGIDDDGSFEPIFPRMVPSREECETIELVTHRASTTLYRKDDKQ